jgi:hypothetical protein
MSIVGTATRPAEAAFTSVVSPAYIRELLPYLGPTIIRYFSLRDNPSTTFRSHPLRQNSRCGLPPSLPSSSSSWRLRTRPRRRPLQGCRHACFARTCSSESAAARTASCPLPETHACARAPAVSWRSVGQGADSCRDLFLEDRTSTYSVPREAAFESWHSWRPSHASLELDRRPPSDGGGGQLR